jgi:threonine dehydratase
VVHATGATFVHPYEEPRVVAGQGTAALELLDEVPNLDVVLTPVGGGGLLSGTAVAATENSRAEVIGAEPEGADDAHRSFYAGQRIAEVDARTVCDGLRTALGALPFAIITDRVSDVVTVSDAATVRAMRWVFERMKMVIEPSSAVPVAAVMERRLPERFRGARIGIVLSGGNVDLDRLPWTEA